MNKRYSQYYAILNYSERAYGARSTIIVSPVGSFIYNCAYLAQGLVIWYASLNQSSHVGSSGKSVILFTFYVSQGGVGVQLAFDPLIFS